MRRVLFLSYYGTKGDQGQFFILNSGHTVGRVKNVCKHIT